MHIDFPKEIKKILVTGGAGFIGGALIRRLLKITNAKIYNLDKLNYASSLDSIDEVIQKEFGKNKDRHFLLKKDLKNFKETYEAISFVEPDLVFHLAAESHVDRSIDDPSEFINSNIVGTFNLLESIRKYLQHSNLQKQKIFKFHHISTDEVYGSLGDFGSFNENTPYDPRSPYSASKASSDHLVNSWFSSYKIPILMTNCSNNYGPWQFPEKLIPLVISKALNNEKIPIYGDGKNIRDWLFVEDHIDALILVALKGKIGRNYCVGGNGEKTNKEVVMTICKLLDKKFPSTKSYSNLISYVQDRPGHDKRYSINSSRIQSELDWKPKHSFEEGISSTIDWYLENQKWLKKIQNSSGYKGERIGI